MFDRIVTPIIAVGLGFLVWVYIRSRDQELHEREIPVALQVAPSQAEQFVIDLPAPPHVPVVFTGPPSRIREVQALFRQGALRLQQTLSVPEDRAKDTREATLPMTVRLDAAALATPPGVRAEIPELRKTLTVSLKRIVEMKLPVRLNHAGLGAVERVTFEPSTVVVRGPKEILDRETAMPTVLYVPRPVEAEKGEQTLQLPIRLATKLGDQQVTVEPAVVQATIVLKGPRKTQELADVPIHFLMPTPFPFRPKFASDRAGLITLKVRGPNTEAKPAVSAFVDLTSRKFGAGLHADEPVKVQLPPGYELLTEPLPRVTIQLDPVDAPIAKGEDKLVPQ